MTKEINKEITTINFDIHDPIDMVDLSVSLKALAGLYKEFVIEQTEDKTKTVAVKLRITSVNNNCITAIFISYIAIAGSVLTVLECVKISVGFIKWLSKAKKHFKKVADKGSVDELRCPLSEKQMKHFENLTDIVAKSSENCKKNTCVKLRTLETRPDSSTISTDFEVSSNDILEIQKGINLERATIENNRKDPSKSLSLRFTQGNVGDSKGKSQAGFRGVIKTISEDNFPVHMPKEIRAEIKKRMNDAKGNPFTVDYLVKVVVKRDAKGEPAAYKIVDLEK